MKRNLNRSLKIAGILLLVLCAYQVTELVLVVNKVLSKILEVKYNWLDYTLSGIEIALSLATGISYLVFSKKKEKEILKYPKLFFALSMVNVLNSFVGWVISFWIELTFEQVRRFSALRPINIFNRAKTENEEENSSSNSKLDDNGNIIVGEDDFEVLHTETLTSRLEELEKLRAKKLISEEEYVDLRQEAINKFLN